MQYRNLEHSAPQNAFFYESLFKSFISTKQVRDN